MLCFTICSSKRCTGSPSSTIHGGQELYEAVAHRCMQSTRLTWAWTSSRAAPLSAAGHPASCHTVTEQVLMNFYFVGISLPELAIICSQQPSLALYGHHLGVGCARLMSSNGKLNKMPCLSNRRSEEPAFGRAGGHRHIRAEQCTSGCSHAPSMDL